MMPWDVYPIMDAVRLKDFDQCVCYVLQVDASEYLVGVRCEVITDQGLISPRRYGCYWEAKSDALRRRENGP